MVYEDIKPSTYISGRFLKRHAFGRSCRWQVLEIQTIPRERMQELFFRKEGEKRTWKEDYLRQNQ
ncbi:hypothetical protein [Dorea longicatena]|uniref:Uncharacterized protein n=2 Tax=Dorea longicatena TaxID=88431 RepID=A0A6L8S0X1_9FIRM|nr:hypothetical protein [Dorea longicatena]MCB5914570.1 hypothetical protein [Lachnospiraceae bacterium 210521-DFI.5.19]MCB5917290.1 hypothetical protein [Lachnospiraceae bacterium 210521-DFI.3.101]EDM63603.1 hypothetical protein DORLON_00886 [Dorea longicatena DSM 13814]MCG4797737.1 hypothetical protein [Dorea longicatena]MCQ4893669.1 hypothetical protein [Dorea longicatena]